jgi:hypothetical protein
MPTDTPPPPRRPSRPTRFVYAAACLGLAAASSGPEAQAEPWPAEKANAWDENLDWLVGANFVPSSAINQLEMWQAETFDPDGIDRELGWAASLGMNTMRVFLHDIAWREDPDGFFGRVDRYLEIADRHGIGTMFVIFDGVWHPYPQPGKQPEPKPGLHNSGWVQSPGRALLETAEGQDSLKPYVQAVVTRYREDPRVLVWDVFNEPDNPNRNSYGENGTKQELPPDTKTARATELLRKTFAWAREANPTQPLTCGVWAGDYLDNPTPFHRLCLDESDVVSFHSYHGPDETRRLVDGLAKLGRPVLCTEYMARGNNSTFQGILPLLKETDVAAYNWGFVDGRSQTIYPWDSWQKPYDSEPNPWFHDIFRRDGTPYRQPEVDLIRRLTGRGQEN